MVAATAERRVPWAGRALCAAGLLFGAATLLRPMGPVPYAGSAIWAGVHVAWLVAYLLAITGFLALLPRVVRSSGWGARVGWALALAGTLAALPVALWDGRIAPLVAGYWPNPITELNELSIETPMLGLKALFVYSAIAFCAGYILFGLIWPRLIGAPRMIDVLIVTGAPLLWAGALGAAGGGMDYWLTSAGAALLGLGMAWFGARLGARPV